MNPDTFFTKELYDRNWFSQHSALIETPLRNNTTVGTSTQLVRLGDHSKCMALTDMPLDLSPQKNVFCNPLQSTEDGPLDLSLKTFKRAIESPHHVNAVERYVSNSVTSQLIASSDQSNRHAPCGIFGQYHHKLTKDGKFVLRQEAIVYGCSESLSPTKYEPPFGGQSKRSMETLISSKSTRLLQANVKTKSKIKIENSLVTRIEVPPKHSFIEILKDARSNPQFVRRYEPLPSPRCSPDSTNLSCAQLPSKSNNPNVVSPLDSTCLILSNDAKTTSTSTLEKSHTHTTYVQESTCPSTDSLDKMSTSIEISNINKIRQNHVTTKAFSAAENHFSAIYDNSNQFNMMVSSHNIFEENLRIKGMPVSSKPTPSPLQISIPGNSKPVSKLCSRKHKILEAVSRDDRLKNIVSFDKCSKATSVSNGKLYDTTDSSTRSSSFPEFDTSFMTDNTNWPVSPASPVMPILSPQSRYPEPMSSASISEPPALDPAMTLADGDTVKAKTEDNATFIKQEDMNQRSKANVARFETTGRSALFPKKRNIPVANVAPNVHLHDSPLKSDASEILSNLSPEGKSDVKTSMSRKVRAKSCQANSTCNKVRSKRKMKSSNEESVLSEQKSGKCSERNAWGSSRMSVASKKKRVETNKDRPGPKNSRAGRQSVSKDQMKAHVKQGPQQNNDSNSNVMNLVGIESKLSKRVLSKRDLSLCKQDKMSPGCRNKQDIKKERNECREIKKPRRSSMLGEIANSQGFVDELKLRRSSTDNLLVDPSLLSREEKALRVGVVHYMREMLGF